MIGVKRVGSDGIIMPKPSWFRIPEKPDGEITTLADLPAIVGA
jgi:hypothetical protein